ncbi:MAG: hypothetical protein M3Y40_09340, partial [Chloroflexota bacterium]|nr:hypothetical protein [Chloroflexota bacterium]
RAPTWSPDGSRLLYGANIPYQPCADCLPPPEPGDLELMVVDLAGGGDPVAFTADGSTSRGGQPTYSPDGTLVAFSGPPRDPDPGIFGATYLIGADGSEARLLADGAYPAGWLVDGRLLVTRERDSTVHAIDVASGESVQVGGDQSASVSPDGTRSLVWMSDPVTGAPGLQLWTGEGKLVGETLGTFGAWNPDSSTFAIFGNDSGLHVVSRDGELLASYEIGASGGTAAWRPGS